MKNILITGATSGLGEEFALQYAASGIRLVLTGRNPDRLQDIVDRCISKGADVTGIVTDVCDRDKMAELVKSSQQQAGPFDLVIANAGISGGFDGQSIDNIQNDYRVFETNLTGVLNTIYPALPAMITAKKGHLVIISSLASFIPMPSAPAYSASKVAVRFYGEALASKLRPHGIKVSVVCPGFIISRMTDVNNFPMPFLMKTDQAVRLMREGIAKGKTKISFPWQMAIPLRLLSCLPSGFIRWLFSKLPDKSSA